VDATVVVYTDAETQRTRVMERGTMSAKQFAMILEKQMPSDDKRACADYTVETDTVENARHQVAAILQDIRETRLNA
jgi:dephospho-CoA kinase